MLSVVKPGSELPPKSGSPSTAGYSLPPPTVEDWFAPKDPPDSEVPPEMPAELVSDCPWKTPSETASALSLPNKSPKPLAAALKILEATPTSGDDFTRISTGLKIVSLPTVTPSNSGCASPRDWERASVVEVSPSHNGNLSICKLLDYGKMKYENNKNKKKHKKREVTKEIRFGVNISSHDLEVKNKKVLSLLEKKFKVKYVLFLKGREKQHILEAEEKMNNGLKSFDGFARWDKVQFSGNYFSTVLFPLK